VEILRERERDLRCRQRTGVVRYGAGGGWFETIPHEEMRGKSTTFSTSLSSNYGEPVSVACGTGTGQENIRLYQFRTNTNSPCLASGTCSGSTFTTQALCVVTPALSGPPCCRQPSWLRGQSQVLQARAHLRTRISCAS
jgi:hypothetical protein